MSLLEIIIGATILMMLMAVLFFVYRAGASAWKKGEAQTEMLQEMQSSLARLNREAERTTLASVATEPGAISFLSPLDSTGQVRYDAANQVPIWQKYVIMYYDAAAQKVYWREEPLAAGAPEAGRAEPITQYDAGGMQPLASYRANGKLIAQNIARCELTLNGGFLEVLMEGTRRRYGSGAPEKLLLRSAVTFRN